MIFFSHMPTQYRSHRKIQRENQNPFYVCRNVLVFNSSLHLSRIIFLIKILPLLISSPVLYFNGKQTQEKEKLWMNFLTPAPSYEKLSKAMSHSWSLIWSLEKSGLFGINPKKEPGNQWSNPWNHKINEIFDCYTWSKQPL